MAAAVEAVAVAVVVAVVVAARGRCRTLLLRSYAIKGSGEPVVLQPSTPGGDMATAAAAAAAAAAEVRLREGLVRGLEARGREIAAASGHAEITAALSLLQPYIPSLT